MDIIDIPAYTYAVFSIKGRPSSNALAETITRVNDEWMPSSGYKYAADFYMDSYGPGNPNVDDYVFELWIPIEKKEI